MLIHSRRHTALVPRWFPIPTLAALLLMPMSSISAQDPPRLGESPLTDVIEAMSVDEKVSLLVGMGFHMNIPFLPTMDPEDAKVPEKVPGAAGRTHAIERLGIPSLTLSDGPAGLRIDLIRDDDSSRTYAATAFPVATLLASSWDTTLLRAVGGAFGREALEYGVDIILAPGMNIHRNPLGGRNFEYYSEDPLLSGTLGAAFIAGVEAEGVGTAPKHFAANNQEFNRMKSNTLVSERTLREIYLRGFEIAVRSAQPWSVMTAYNLINGTYAPESRELLTSVLRDEWGFEGFVMTDWFGGVDAVAMMNAGNDVLMPGYVQQTKDIVAAAADGSLSEAQLNENVERVLRIVLQSPSYRQYPYSDQPDLTAHAQLARRTAADGMVLLKNDDDALPLPPGRTVALLGNASYDPIVGGTGSGDVNEAYAVALDEGLVAAGYVVEASLQTEYRSYIADQKAQRPPQPLPFFPSPPIPELMVGSDRITQLAGETDVAVVAIGRNSGEFSDRDVDDNFLLTTAEQSLLRHVSTAFRSAGKKVVVVLNVAGVVEVASWRDHADAILVAWQPGQEGGNAIADVVSGTVNPSGRLPMTFPMAYDDVPSAGNFPGRVLPEYQDEPASIFGVPTEVTYDEGLYVGYRYYNTFDVEPAYPFGYGLSYTEFDCRDLQLSASALRDSMTVTVLVRNVGDTPGREVVQLYVSAPSEALDKPESELRGFAKTGLLEPGQSETITLTLSTADLASFDSKRAAWITEAGTYTAKVGTSALAIAQTATFSVPQEVLVQQVQNALVPPVPIEERTDQTR